MRVPKEVEKRREDDLGRVHHPPLTINDSVVKNLYGVLLVRG